MLKEEDNLFGDLPEEDGGGEENEGEGKGKPPASGKVPTEDEVRQLKIANKEADRKLDFARKASELREQLAAKRAETKRLKTEGEGEGEGGENAPLPPPAAPKESDVQKVVEETLRKQKDEENKSQLISKIKSIAKSRNEAEGIYAEAQKSQSTGDLELDVKLASDRYTELRKRSLGFSSPGGGGGFDDMGSGGRPEEIAGVSKERMEWMKVQGVKQEDVARLKDGYDLHGMHFAKVQAKEL